MDPTDEVSTGFHGEERSGRRLVDELPVGSQIGPYTVVGTLGQGGMGQVLLGNDPRLHRQVALKRLLSSGPSAGDRARVVREARAAAQVNHPNVATVHDIIEHGLQAFIVMEYVEGETLATLLRRERLPIDRVVGIGLQLAAAVAAAHAKGVIHRDLKPANIQLTRDGTVKVLDFGVSGTTTRFITATSTAPHGEIREHQPGTRGYMAPEQLLAGHADERSDVFSLGVVLFEMATGQRAYIWVDELDLAAAMARTVRRADAADGHVPRRLADVIAKALALDPARRLQSAAALKAALEGLDRSARPAGGAPSLRRMVSGAGIAVPLLLLSAIFFGLLTSTAFNVTTGRVPPFVHDSPKDWFELGLRSFVAPGLYISAMVVVGWAALFALRVLSLIGTIDRVIGRVRSRVSQVVARLGLDDPIVFGQAVAAAGLAALLIVIWGFADLLLACFTTISDGEASRLAALGPGHRGAWFRFALDVLLLAFGCAIVRIRWLRRARPPGQPGWPLTPIVTLAIATMLLSELPYRLLWQNQAERIEFAGNRCYVLGTNEGTGLIYCPDTPPPRIRVVEMNDRALQRLGRPRESIFTAPDSSR